jgi:hypothetical protein
MYKEYVAIEAGLTIVDTPNTEETCLTCVNSIMWDFSDGLGYCPCHLATCHMDQRGCEGHVKNYIPPF